MQKTQTYGIHWDKKTAWLLQNNQAYNFLGLKGSSPFQINTKEECPHSHSSAAPLPTKQQWGVFSPLLEDPLVQAMLPIPKAQGEVGAYYVNDPEDKLRDYLACLLRLSCPVVNQIRPLWMVENRYLKRSMGLTNIQPLIFAQCLPTHQSMVDTIMRTAAYSPRRVIMTGSDDVVVQAPAQRIETRVQETDLQSLLILPLESIGTTILRRYCRGEAIDGPMETREERRARQISERKGTQ